MPGLVIVGAQWGDEGKGKVTDLLAEQADVVIRFQGGNSAGHTIVRGEDVVLRSRPMSGIAPSVISSRRDTVRWPIWARSSSMPGLLVTTIERSFCQRSFTIE